MPERKTENLLEQLLRKAGYEENDFQFQGSTDEDIQRYLPSKKGGKEGKGKPEYIIRLNGDAADLLVIECKAGKKDHASAPDINDGSLLKPVQYAEDGVIHYMRGLRREFNVIGLAVSGEDNLEITTFRVLRDGKIERVLTKNVLKREDYLGLLKNSAGYGEKTAEDIIDFARELHEYLRDNMELSESYKPLIVSGILLALRDLSFERGYRDIDDRDDLASAMKAAIERTLKKAKVKDDKFTAMMSNYSFIETNKAVKEYLRKTVGMIYRNLFFALQSNSSFDLLGSFYGEFLRYSGGDKQGLGIVLTPRHITELFADIADLNPNESVVLDICAGTGGFLISSMADMFEKASGDSNIISRITNKGLIGIELDPQMFTLACANMILRGDGKANMFQDDSLEFRETDAEKKIRELKPNVGMLNPPYSKKAKGKSELRFVQRLLELLQPNSIGIAIIPVPSLVDMSKESLQIKKELLEKHTLRAVMSMPPQLFPKIGAVTAIVVFTAHTSHFRTKKDEKGNNVLVPKQETWFGYWRDDGFVISKNKRLERRPGIWEQIKREWLDAYFNQRVTAGRIRETS